MDHFTIFQDFYRVIAEMTEEEIVSAISNGTYRETVEDVRRIFAEQGEKAANEKKIELPEITFSANYRGGRSRNSRQVSGIHRGRHRPSDTGSIGTHPRTGKKVCPHPHRFHQPQRNGTENRGTCMPDGRDIARNDSGN